jgi:hypothetical protein
VPPHWWTPVRISNPRPDYKGLEDKVGGPDKVIGKWKSHDGRRAFAVVTAADKPHPDAIFLVDDDLVDER